MEVKEIIAQHEEKMDKTIEALKRELSSIRTGRASTSLLDRITVDYYGTPAPVKQVANVAAPEPRMITIAPWEPKMLGEIEKAILKSDLGLNPNNDGKIIRLEIPQLTEERRKELSKKVSKIAEDSKVVIRNIRRDANETIKKMEKKKEVTEDDSKEGQENIQKLTDKKIKVIDEIKAKKKRSHGRMMDIRIFIGMPLRYAKSVLQEKNIPFVIERTLSRSHFFHCDPEQIYVIRAQRRDDGTVCLLVNDSLEMSGSVAAALRNGDVQHD